MRVMPLLAGATGGVLISVAPLLTPDLKLLNSVFNGPDQFRVWVLWGFALHIGLFGLFGLFAILPGYRSATPVRAFQQGIAAPTAFLAALNISPAKPAFENVDPKAIPVAEQMTCKNFTPLNALVYGGFTIPLPEGLDLCIAAATPAFVATAITSSPTSLSVSDFVSGRLNVDPSLRDNWLPELIDTLKPEDDAVNAAAVNKSIARTLALTNGLEVTPDQLQKLEELKQTPAYKSDPTFSYWTNRAIDQAAPTK